MTILAFLYGLATMFVLVALIRDAARGRRSPGWLRGLGLAMLAASVALALLMGGLALAGALGIVGLD